MNYEIWWTAVGLVLLIEGLLPFFAPNLWQKVVLKLIQQGPNSIRCYGLVSLVLGLLMLWLR